MSKALMSPGPATAVRRLGAPLAVATLASMSLSLGVGSAAARASASGGVEPSVVGGERMGAPVEADEAGTEAPEAPSPEIGEEEELLERANEPSQGGAGGSVGVAGAATSTEGQAVSAGEAGLRLSSLKLERTTATALVHRAVRASQIRFAFTLSAPANVRVTFARGSNRAGEVRWRGLPDPLTLTCASGVNHARLHGGGVLARGEYRLTLVAGHGVTRSILMRVK